MAKVLVCGSRNMIPEMLDRIERSIQWAHGQGHTIICGDAPGVDSAVMVMACKLDMLVNVYGVTPEPRNICCDKHRALYIQVNGNYLARDRVMVNESDRVVGFCLNQSPGTMYTCRYANDMGKPVGILHWLQDRRDRYEVFGVR